MAVDNEKIGLDQIEGLESRLASLGGGSSPGRPGSKLTTSVMDQQGIVVRAGRQMDSTGKVEIVLTESVQKTLAAAWAPHVYGAMGGGKDEAFAVLNTSVQVFAIYNAATKGVDVLLSRSATFPKLPAGFTHYRRLGAFLTDAAGKVRPFRQFGNEFFLIAPITDYSNQLNFGVNLRKISVPDGLKVKAKIFYHSRGTADADAYHSGVFDPDLGYPPSYGTPQQYAQVRRTPRMLKSGAWYSYEALIFEQWTNSQREVFTYGQESQDYIVVRILGWTDPYLDELRPD